MRASGAAENDGTADGTGGGATHVAVGPPGAPIRTVPGSDVLGAGPAVRTGVPGSALLHAVVARTATTARLSADRRDGAELPRA